MSCALLVLAGGAGRRLGFPKARARLAGQTFAQIQARAGRRAGCDPVILVLGCEAEGILGEHPDLREAARVVTCRDWETGQFASLRAGLCALSEQSGCGVSPPRPAELQHRPTSQTVLGRFGDTPKPDTDRLRPRPAKLQHRPTSQTVLGRFGDTPQPDTDRIREEKPNLFVLPVDALPIKQSTFEALEGALEPGLDAVVPVHGGRKGHPVLLSSGFWPGLLELDPARARLDHILAAARVGKIAVDDPGVLANINTPKDLKRLESRLEALRGVEAG